MPMEKKAAVIGGVQYEVATLDAWSSLPVWHKIAKVLAPTMNAINVGPNAIDALAQVAAGLDPEKTDMRTLAMIGKIATAAADVAIRSMDPVDLRYCVDAFAEATTVQTSPTTAPKLKMVFADLYAGNLTAMWKWFYFCLQINYGDFYDLALAMLRSAREQKNVSSVESAVTGMSPSPSPAASTPSSSA